MWWLVTHRGTWVTKSTASKRLIKYFWNSSPRILFFIFHFWLFYCLLYLPLLRSFLFGWRHLVVMPGWCHFPSTWSFTFFLHSFYLFLVFISSYPEHISRGDGLHNIFLFYFLLSFIREVTFFPVNI